MTKNIQDRIIWAVDPTLGDTQLLKTAGRAICSFLQREETAVEPVYVLLSGMNLLRSDADGPFPEVRELTRTLGDQQVKKATAAIKIRRLLPFKVLNRPSSGTRQSALELVRYAKESGATAIVTSTHAAKGVSRWLLGSFAESLALYSDIPLLVINPRWKGSGFKTVIFPTDFSNESKDAFSRVLEFASQLGKKVIIFNKFPYDVTPGIQAAFEAFPTYADALRKEISVRRAQAELWAREGKKRGVKVEIQIDQKRLGSVTDGILALAKRKQGLIAMASHSGLARAVLIGSATRQVLRQATVPVWVIHPESKASGKKESKTKDRGTSTTIPRSMVI